MSTIYFFLILFNEGNSIKNFRKSRRDAPERRVFKLHITVSVYAKLRTNLGGTTEGGEIAYTVLYAPSECEDEGTTATEEPWGKRNV